MMRRIRGMFMPDQQQSDDVYPSRQGFNEFSERCDPTVYAPISRVAPLSQQQIDDYAENGFMVL